MGKARVAVVAYRMRYSSSHRLYINPQRFEDQDIFNVSMYNVYDLRKGDLFVLRCARVRRVRQESISSVLPMFGGGVRSIFYVGCSDCVGYCGNVCCVAAVVKYSGFVEPWSVEVCCMFV